ncbi:hypothetical protein MTR67_007847 [Solanum verrucosum]|uniref:Ras-related protein RHN1 n=1 Tax=Solanum verrucosum TaxID=315347 RepID=A0AAF0Q112_SOLVR|nr:hypothetical protein MTR67_007847 [Solanum verrucosum]
MVVAGAWLCGNWKGRLIAAVLCAAAYWSPEVGTPIHCRYGKWNVGLYFVKCKMENLQLNTSVNWDFFIFHLQHLIMAETAHNNLNAKLVLLGDMGAGKSSLVIRFVKGQFLEFQESTIGAAFFSSTVSVNNSTVKFEIWDTAGQERYHSLAPMYYRGAAAAIIVYDITSTDSFVRAKKWVQELQKQGNPNMVMALTGNKADLEDKRKVTAEEARLYAEENGLFFMETSAKTAANVNDIFYKIELYASTRVSDRLLCHVDVADRGAKRLPRGQPAQNPAGMVLVDRTAEGSQTASCCS